MNAPIFRLSPLSIALGTILLLLSACGGGGGDSTPATTAAALPATSLVASTVAAADPAPAVAVQADTSGNTLDLAAAMQATAVPDSTAAVDGTPVVVAASTDASAASIATEQASAMALGTRAGQSVGSDAGIAPVVGVSAVTTAANVYYFNSATGNDANNGLVATAGAAGTGPWRSLAKLGGVTLKPGDTVRLACGSEWRETLSLSSSGTATQPISVTAFPSGCSNAPVIDGSQTLAATDWRLHQGNIYKATLATAPLQFFGGLGYMAAAHHPNRGYDTANPDSPYLKLAATSDSVFNGSAMGSTYITTGADLVLPAGASVAAGTQVRMRVNSWLLDERSVAAVSDKRLLLDKISTYGLTSGWGYYLIGQLWMLDSAGEWHYDATSKQLYAWMPDGRTPGASTRVSLLPTGVDLQSRQYVTVDGLKVRKVGTGVDMRRSVGVVFKNGTVEDTAHLGINMSGSVKATIASNTISRTTRDAITGLDHTVAVDDGTQVLDNTISESGVVMSGSSVVSNPVRNYAAVRAGTNALVRGNTITNTAYVGIWTLANGTISNNLLNGTCTVVDDCGAIYLSLRNNNSLVSGNLIQNSRGSLAGKGPEIPYTQAQGIYLDESASGVTVVGNTVVGADNGLHLHVSANNTIKDNKFYGNRVSQLWMQENRKTDNPLGDVFGNVVTGNQVVPTTAAAKGLLLETQITSTQRFGSFDYNRYYDRIFTTVAVESVLGTRTDYTLAQWKAATANGSARGLDTNGSGASQTRFASILVNGSNVVPNGKLTSNALGWSAWNATAPYGAMVREVCTPGYCARYTAGGSAGILSSPNFSVTAGTWYRLSMDVATGVDGQAINLVVRRGGGGTNGYESLADRSLNLAAQRAWRRYSVVFQATKTVNAADPSTKDLGARADLQNVMPGQAVSVSNLELVPITPADALNRSDILLNASHSPTQVACPAATTASASCALYVKLSDNTAVTWPYYLAARASEIVYTRDARLIDSDGDGIPDSQDKCPATAAGAVVNSYGCGLGEG